MQVPPFWRWMAQPRQVAVLLVGIGITIAATEALKATVPSYEATSTAFAIGAAWAFVIMLVMEHLPDYDGIEGGLDQ